jgi:hypothetical protein
MTSTYLDLLSQMQAQGLDVLKAAQKAQIEALTSAREALEKLPTIPMPAIPALEGLPTLAQVTELNNAFVTNVIEQQTAYATALAEVFAPLKKNAAA